MDDNKLTQEDINRMMQEQIAKKAGKAAGKPAETPAAAAEKPVQPPFEAVEKPAQPPFETVEKPVAAPAAAAEKAIEMTAAEVEKAAEMFAAVVEKPAETPVATVIKAADMPGRTADTISAADIASSRNHFTTLEIDTLGEVGNISMGAAATALYSILGRKVVITTPNVSITSYKKLIENHLAPYFVVNVEYTEGFLGSNLFILQLEDVRIITDIMMGGDGTNSGAEMDEIHISAISEAMNQMMGAMSTSMATLFSRDINISPPKSAIVQLAEYGINEILTEDTNELVRISFSLQIEGLIDSSIMQLLPLEFAKTIVSDLLNPPAVQAPAKMNEPPSAPPPQPVRQETYAAPSLEPAYQTPTPRAASNDSIRNEPAARYEDSKGRPVIDARPIQLTSFDAPAPSLGMNANELGIDIILDVPLQVKVELGQCKKTIKEVLDLNIGSVLALDKLAGEPVDLVANGKAIAKGEVIVIEDSYGIRITEILSPASRLRKPL